MPLDFVNFHWYGDDGPALKESVAYLRRATAEPVITTEIGQYPIDAGQVTTDLKVAVDDLRMPYVIWFDYDGIPAHGLHSARPTATERHRLRPVREHPIGLPALSGPGARMRV